MIITFDSPSLFIHVGVGTGVLLAICGFALLLYSLSLKLRGSRRRWLKPIFPGIVLLLMGVGFVVLTIEHKPSDEWVYRESNSFDIEEQLEELLNPRYNR